MTARSVFIHTNAKQRLGAEVARHALRRNSRAPERFSVCIVDSADWPFLQDYEDRHYLREGRAAVWRNDDLQSFAPLRFTIPQLMGYRGRALVIDPDVFAIGDVNELLDIDMQGAAILARRMPERGRRPRHYASSVMLLDCAQLRHWQPERDFARLFSGERDYRDWMWLLNEPAGSIGELPPQWNDFDYLGPTTRMLHNTRRRTQPWKTGLPADFTLRGSTAAKRLSAWARGAIALVIGHSPGGYYRPHPDPAQERLFFDLLGECLAAGGVDERRLRDEIARRHLRPDAFEKLRRTASMEAERYALS